MLKFSVKFLFNSKGKAYERGKGLRIYEKEDFDSKFFSCGWDIVNNRLGNGCCIDYPIFLKPIQIQLLQ